MLPRPLRPPARLLVFSSSRLLVFSFDGTLSTNSSRGALGYSLPITLDPYVVQAGFARTKPGGRR